jgi:AraC-like DNA-binding protein
MKEETKKAHNANINIALTFIEKHFTEKITVKKLATIACLSVFHFHRLFKEKTGLTVFYYIKKIRLEHGAKLLLSSTANVNEIALESGFADSESFCHAFKKHFKITPSDLREIISAISRQFAYPSNGSKSNTGKDIKIIYAVPGIKQLRPEELSKTSTAFKALQLLGHSIVDADNTSNPVEEILNNPAYRNVPCFIVNKKADVIKGRDNQITFLKKHSITRTILKN